MCHITSLRNLSCLFLKLSPDLFYHKEIRDTRKYRRCDPCRRIGETGERIAQKLHRRHGDNQSRDELSDTPPIIGRKPYPQPCMILRKIKIVQSGRKNIAVI